MAFYTNRAGLQTPISWRARIALQWSAHRSKTQVVPGKGTGSARAEGLLLTAHIVPPEGKSSKTPSPLWPAGPKLTGLGARAGQRGWVRHPPRSWNQLSIWTCSFPSREQCCWGSRFTTEVSFRLPSRSYPHCQSSCSLGSSIAPGHLTKSGDPALAHRLASFGPAGHGGEEFFGPFYKKRTLPRALPVPHPGLGRKSDFRRPGG